MNKNEKPKSDEYIESPKFETKGWKIPKYILMKAHESKGARIHERKESDIVIGPSLKWT